MTRLSESQSEGVAVVAIGALTPFGSGVDALWQGAVAGQVAIGKVDSVGSDGETSFIGGEVSQRYVPESDHTRRVCEQDKAYELALAAADDCLSGAAELLSEVPADRVGVVVGTCNGGLLAGRDWLAASLRNGAESPAPDLATLVTPQAIAEAVAGAHRLGGPIMGVNTACASGGNAIGLAKDLIDAGQADVVLAGGVDALSDICFAGFRSLEAISPDPARPYSRDRSGLSLGEGAAFLLLARAELLRERRCLAWIGGYGLSADAYHPTAPHPDGAGAARAISTAVGQAGLAPNDIHYVNGHGTGTPKNDVAETKAIRLALGAAASAAAISSTKSMVGHLLGAAGAVEAAVTVMALINGQAPPTASYLGTDPDCDLDYVPNTARPVEARAAASNNFAFGGSNVCVVLRRSDNRPEPRGAEPQAVVISGISALGPFGTSVRDAEQAVASGTSVPASAAGRVATMALDPDPYIDRRARRRLDRFTIASIAATQLALADSGIDRGSFDDTSIGVIMGTALGPAESMEEFTVGVLREGTSGADPAKFPNTVYNQAAGQVCQHLGLRGPTSTVSVGHASGAAALAYGYWLIRTGRARAIVCLAVDLLTDAVTRAYRDLKLVSSAPGDSRFALTDAAVAIVLERADSARDRTTNPLVTLDGFGCAADTRWDRRPAPSGDASARAVSSAMRSAGLRPGDVGSVWPATAGGRVFDRAENRGLGSVFGAAAVKTQTPKLVLGEPIGPGGALTSALAATSLADNPGERAAVVNAVSLGGTSVSLVLSNSAVGSAS